MTTGVDTQHTAYTTMLPTWTLMHDITISEKHIHDKDIAAKGKLYLPKLDEMTDTQYAAYVKRASFPLFTKHALASFVGMAMRKDLLITGVDVDHQFFKNCDGKGTSLKEYSEKLVADYLQYTRSGTLIEMPEAEEGISIAEAEKRNINVRLSYYHHLSIINWKTDIINNQELLKMVVLKEFKDVGENFDHTPEARYRVLFMDDGVYKQQMYDNGGNKVGNELTPKINNKSFKYIPFIIHGGTAVKQPVVLPIAEQNIHWYMKDADYQHGLHYTALPTPWMTGVDHDDKNRPKTIGPTKLWCLPEGATVGMLEFSGAGLEQVEKSMQNTLTNITMLSSQILVPKNTFDETATAASIRNATETAALSSIVNGLSAELTTAINIAALWGKFHKEGITVKINSDFIPLTLSGADVSAYVSAMLKDGFSRYTLFSLLKKGEIVEGDRQLEDEVADIEKESAERKVTEVALAKALTEATATEDAEVKEEPTEKDQKGQKTAEEEEEAETQKSTTGGNK